MAQGGLDRIATVRLMAGRSSRATPILRLDESLRQLSLAFLVAQTSALCFANGWCETFGIERLLLQRDYNVKFSRSSANWIRSKRVLRAFSESSGKGVAWSSLTRLGRTCCLKLSL